MSLRWFAPVVIVIVGHGSFVSVADDAPPGGAEARIAWVYAGAPADGSFRKVAGTRWEEVTPEGAQLPFAEVSRNDRYVELFDNSRSMTLRLHEKSSEWRQGENGSWIPLYPGRWVDPKSLPKRPTADYRIRLGYFVPTDRTPTPEYEGKIRVVMHFVSEVYRQDFEARGIRSPGLVFEARDGQPVVHLIRGSRPAAFYTKGPAYDANNQWTTILAEIPPRVGAPQTNLMIVFAETYDGGTADYEWPGGVALGSRFSADGGAGIFSAWILRPEFCATTIEQQRTLFFDTTPIPGRTALGHGGRNSPRFEFIEDGFGAVAHEFGHALGLQHDRRQDQVDIMGNGFRNLRSNFTPTPDPARRARFSDDNARILYSSRFLAPDRDLADRAGPTVHLSWATPPKAGDRQLKVGVTATDDAGLRAVEFFSPAQDSVVGGQALSGKQQTFVHTVEVEPIKAGTVRMQAMVTDVGGNLTTAELTADVGK